MSTEIFTNEAHSEITRHVIPKVITMRKHLHALLSVSSIAWLPWTPVGVCHWQDLPLISSCHNSPDETVASLSRVILLSGCPQHVMTAMVSVASSHQTYKIGIHMLYIYTPTGVQGSLAILG